MARRLTTRQTELACAAIQTAKLIQVLQQHALGKRKLSMTQLQAAKVLLAKTVPDQKATELTGQVEVAWQLKLT